MNTYLCEKTHSGASLTPLETACFDRGVLFLDGSITEDTATRFIQNGMVLALKEIPMTVVINTNGGDLQAGLNIYDFLTSMPHVTTVAVKAYSMGSLLFAAGGKRIMFPHSQLMIHEPLLASGVSGSCSSVETMADVLKSKREQMAALFSKHTGKAAEEFLEIMRKDTYFNAEEAMALGLCDAVETWDSILRNEVKHV